MDRRERGAHDSLNFCPSRPLKCYNNTTPACPPMASACMLCSITPSPPSAQRRIGHRRGVAEAGGPHSNGTLCSCLRKSWHHLRRRWCFPVLRMPKPAMSASHHCGCNGYASTTTTALTHHTLLSLVWVLRRHTCITPLLLLLLLLQPHNPYPHRILIYTRQGTSNLHPTPHTPHAPPSPPHFTQPAMAPTTRSQVSGEGSPAPSPKHAATSSAVNTKSGPLRQRQRENSMTQYRNAKECVLNCCGGWQSHV